MKCAHTNPRVGVRIRNEVLGDTRMAKLGQMWL